ncbi:DUF2911 domain-containing protein [Ulvibacterium marinum]|uniref:DUF2911 domain-containing protein n=1 Tax=Ulvibacterium marinum TaxID=2419782 RepID=A0A3B0C277_9FLAO|nr:DUF2911 domain-containing protein [Ulvibacterium marinum]RKN80063.1 DUF2911 domain-containing protein [Ulvibacterium marinum]
MKFLKWFLIVLVVLMALFFFVGKPYMLKQTKKKSPEKTVTHIKDDFDLSVTYSSPFKKGRVIFGELVPYDAVWRTGANEPTTFSTKTDVKIIDKNLPAGTYSLWTRPQREYWTIMFNKEVPEWGVTFLSGGSETSRDESQDVIQVQVPVEKLPSPQESFTIGFEDGEQLYLGLFWDDTKVKVPINP